MSLYRVIFVALATLFTIGMTSMASANCCGGGYSAPLAYPTVAPIGYGGGCGTCGAPTAAYAAPIAVAPSPIYINNALPTPFGGPCCGMGGCGDCLTYAPAGCGSCGSAGYGGAPVAWGGGCGGYGGCGSAGWGGGGCGHCGAVSYGGCGNCGGASVGYAVGMPSMYVVNQGPVYSGPGMSIPYSTYSPEAAYAPATDYPYAAGAGYAAPSVYPSAYARPYYRGVRPYYRPYLRPRFYGRPYGHPYVRPFRYGYRPYRPVARAAAYGRWRHYP
jgi:hypothetical protein